MARLHRVLCLLMIRTDAAHKHNGWEIRCGYVAALCGYIADIWVCKASR